MKQAGDVADICDPYSKLKLKIFDGDSFYTSSY